MGLHCIKYNTYIALGSSQHGLAHTALFNYIFLCITPDKISGDMILVLGDLTGYGIVPGFISAALLRGVSFRVKKKFKKLKKKNTWSCQRRFLGEQCWNNVVTI